MTSIYQGNSAITQRLLYTASVFARQALLHLQEIGTLTAIYPHTSRRGSLASYLFFYVESGEGNLEYAGTNFVMKSGDCAFIDCRQPYAHGTSSNPWTLRWIHFSGPSMEAVFDKYSARGGLPTFTPKEISHFEKIWSIIEKAADSNDYIRDMRINSALSELLVLLMQESWHPDKERSATSVHTKGKPPITSADS